MVLDPKLDGTDVHTLNPPLRGEFKATRLADGRLLLPADIWRTILYSNLIGSLGDTVS